ASTDILAVDQASIDMVYALPAKERKDLAERIESRKGLRQLSAMEELGMCSRRYRLVEEG
ncbi:MAG: (Fe-S)-binding protein, partial [Desulfovibrio sp.]|nr:(Fe-S)-binding protein [Desulfovibrio sp.]